MTRFHLRPAKIEDLPALRSLEAHCFHVNRLSARSFRHHIRSASGELWVAEMADAAQAPLVVGYGLLLCPAHARHARLYSLAIAPSWRGHGLARLLLESLETVARAKGRNTLRLEVAQNNTPAQTLYHDRGFHTLAHLPNYYDDGTAALRLEKELG